MWISAAIGSGTFNPKERQRHEHQIRRGMGGASGRFPQTQAAGPEVTYVELAKRLKKHGFKGETEASITNKLARGTFSATFLLAVIAALELDGVALEEI